MTDLIYRGIAHTGTKSTTARTAQTLVYRGVAHDGVAARTPAAAPVEMCYRAVVYGSEIQPSVSGAYGAMLPV